MAAMVTILAQIIALLPSLIAAGVQVEGLIARVQSAAASGSPDPTDVQWAALQIEIDALTKQLNTDPPMAG